MAEDWNRLIILDTETSGLKPSRNQILTIDAVHVVKHVENSLVQYKIEGEPFHAEVARQPWAAIDPEAMAVTGINIDLWKGEGEDEVIGKLLSWATRTTGGTYKLICGYNVDFDIQFLKRMFYRSEQFGGSLASKTWTKAFSYRYIDVYQHALLTYMNGYIEEPPKFKLESLARHLGVWREGAHDSLVDVLMTLDVLNELNRRIYSAKLDTGQVKPAEEKD